MRIISLHISCDMYLRLGLHLQIRLYSVLPYKAKISAQHGIGFILDRCIVYLGLTMPNLQKKRPLIFEIFNIKKCTLFFWNRVYNLLYATYFNHHSVLWYVDVHETCEPCSAMVDLKHPQKGMAHNSLRSPQSVQSFCMSISCLSC